MPPLAVLQWLQAAATRKLLAWLKAAGPYDVRAVWRILRSEVQPGDAPAPQSRSASRFLLLHHLLQPEDGEHIEDEEYMSP